MARPKGSKNKRTLAREARLRDSPGGAMAALSYAADDTPNLDCLSIMKEAMWHFRRKAMICLRNGIDDETVDGYVKDAAALADKVAPYYYPKLSALKVSGDKDNPLNGKDRDQLRAEILEEMRELGLFEDMAQLSGPQGVANRKPEDGS